MGWRQAQENRWSHTAKSGHQHMKAAKTLWSEGGKASKNTGSRFELHGEVHVVLRGHPLVLCAAVTSSSGVNCKYHTSNDVFSWKSDDELIQLDNKMRIWTRSGKFRKVENPELSMAW